MNLLFLHDGNWLQPGYNLWVSMNLCSTNLLNQTPSWSTPVAVVRISSLPALQLWCEYRLVWNHRSINTQPFKRGVLMNNDVGWIQTLWERGLCWTPHRNVSTDRNSTGDYICGNKGKWFLSVRTNRKLAVKNSI